jgi:3-oxoacyl-[acyl-carrier protein] reductase
MHIEQVRAVLSGAASGLGREFALQLLAAGASVYAGDIDVAGLRALRRQTKDLPGQMFSQELDVADEAAVTGFVRQAHQAMGELNAAIHCAGILRDGLLVDPRGGELRKMNTHQWTRVLEVNLFGSFFLSRETAAVMLEQGKGGLILNMSSLSRSGNAGQGNYSASKAALDAATRSWAKELGPASIRVAALAPGVVETPFLEGISDVALLGLKSKIPLGRFASPFEIWQAARFVIECDYFTGRVLEIDGGADIASAS